MQHGQTPKNRCLPFAKCLNAWPWCLLFIWLKRWLPSFGLSWHMTPKSSMMTGRCICYAPTTGYNPSIRNCYIHRPATMRQGQEKGTDPAVAWPVSLHTLGHPRPPKKRKPSASGTRFCDWIGGICYADTLQVWFPAHWAPVVLHQLQHKEDTYRAAHPSWMDQEEAPVDIKKQWQEARANRRMQFKVGNYRDGGKESNIRMLTGTIKADWIQLPFLHWDKVSLLGCSGTKEPHLGPSLGLRSCSSRSFFPMTCHWMIGMQESTPCPLCGLMCPCWEPPICAGRLAMTFITYGRSMTS